MLRDTSSSPSHRALCIFAGTCRNGRRIPPNRGMKFALNDVVQVGTVNLQLVSITDLQLKVPPCSPQADKTQPKCASQSSRSQPSPDCRAAGTSQQPQLRADDICTQKGVSGQTTDAPALEVLDLRSSGSDSSQSDTHQPSGRSHAAPAAPVPISAGESKSIYRETDLSQSLSPSQQAVPLQQSRFAHSRRHAAVLSPIRPSLDLSASTSDSPHKAPRASSGTACVDVRQDESAVPPLPSDSPSRSPPSPAPPLSAHKLLTPFDVLAVAASVPLPHSTDTSNGADQISATGQAAIDNGDHVGAHQSLVQSKADSSSLWRAHSPDSSSSSDSSEPISTMVFRRLDKRKMVHSNCEQI